MMDGELQQLIHICCEILSCGRAVGRRMKEQRAMDGGGRKADGEVPKEY